MGLTSRIIRLATRGAAQRFEEASRNAIAVQEAKLLEMVRRNENTEFGRKYGFSSIHGFEDWRRQVPVSTYEDLRQLLDRVFQGESNVLTAEDPVMFAQTSGTTGKPKFIPVTPSCRGQAHSDAQRAWLHHCQLEHPGLLDHSVANMVSKAVEGHSPSGIPYGSTSGHIFKTTSALVRRKSANPYDVFEIEDYQAKYYALMRCAMSHDVGMIWTANPSSILKMFEKGDEFAEEVIKDIRDGTLSRNYDIEPEVRPALERLFKPNRRRAAELEEARRRGDGVLRPREYWPHLQLIGCWKGGTVSHYISKFGDWIDPSIPTHDCGYLSSEVRGSVPLTENETAGPLTVGANLFEFVLAEEAEANEDTSKWNFLHIGELEDGKEYRILPTTTGGLYRYDIADIVEVQGRHFENPKVLFKRKGGGMTNLTGEKLSVGQVIEAFGRAAKETGLVAMHFKAEADIENSRYVLHAEFSRGAEEPQQVAFLRAVDDGLKAVNIEYKAKRDSMRLGDPVLRVMRDGWYERTKRAKVAAGMRAFQAKTELLSLASPEKSPPPDEVVVEREMA